LFQISEEAKNIVGLLYFYYDYNYS